MSAIARAAISQFVRVVSYCYCAIYPEGDFLRASDANLGIRTPLLDCRKKTISAHNTRHCFEAELTSLSAAEDEVTISSALALCANERDGK